MTEYEQFSLALTAIGHLVVALSIVYAARSWLVSERSLKREIQKDTRSYLSDIDAQIRSMQRELYATDVNPGGLEEDPESRMRVNGLLNIVESVGYEMETDFYDSKAIRRYVTPLAASIWNRWHPYVFENRVLLKNTNLWAKVETLADSYNNALQSDA